MFIIKTFYFILFCALTYTFSCIPEVVVGSWLLANNPLEYIEAISKTLASIVAIYFLLGLISFCLYMIIVVGTPRKKSFLIFMSAYVSFGILIVACLNFYKPGFKEEFNFKKFILKKDIKELFSDKNKLKMISEGIEEFKGIDKEEYIKKIPDSLLKATISILKGLLFLIAFIILGLVYIILGFEEKDKSIIYLSALGIGALFVLNSLFIKNKLYVKIIYYIMGVLFFILPFLFLFIEKNGFI